MDAKAGSGTAEKGLRPRAPWRVRIAAVVGLLAPVAMVLVAAIALSGKVSIAVLAVALVLVASAAAWIALTTRSTARAVAAALVVLAGAGLVVVLVTNPHGAVALIVMALLAATFGLTARYALGQTGAASEVVAGGQSGGAPRPAVLIINPKSGGGKAERFHLVSEAERRGVEAIVLKLGDDLLELAEGAIDRGAKVVGMAGGDGSQALVATVAARRGVAHVCIPAGTRNHFALDLGLDRDDVVGALDAFTDGLERTIDLAQVNGRVFVNNASLGVYAKVVQSDAYRDAKLQTWTDMLPDLLGRDAPAIGLELTEPDGRECANAPLILISNNPYQLTHFSGAGTRVRLDTGTLGVVLAEVGSASDVSKLVALELAGQVGRFPGLRSWSAPQIEVRSEQPVEVGLDGEALVLDPPLRFESMPGALRVLVPRSAGQAPAARSVYLTSENLAALLRVALGR